MSELIIYTRDGQREGPQRLRHAGTGWKGSNLRLLVPHQLAVHPASLGMTRQVAASACHIHDDVAGRAAGQRRQAASDLESTSRACQRAVIHAHAKIAIEADLAAAHLGTPCERVAAGYVDRQAPLALQHGHRAVAARRGFIWILGGTLGWTRLRIFCEFIHDGLTPSGERHQAQDPEEFAFAIHLG